MIVVVVTSIIVAVWVMVFGGWIRMTTVLNDHGITGITHGGDIDGTHFTSIMRGQSA